MSIGNNLAYVHDYVAARGRRNGLYFKLPWQSTFKLLLILKSFCLAPSVFYLFTFFGSWYCECDYTFIYLTFI